MEFKVNCNNYAKVKLTDRGIQILEENHNTLNQSIKERGGKALSPFELKVDEDGYYTNQLWYIMGKLGQTMFPGNRQAFDVEMIIKDGRPLQSLGSSKIDAAISEIEYALSSNKSEDVKRHYLENAIRYLKEAKEGTP